MLHEVLVAVVAEAPGQFLADPVGAVHLPQQQAAPVAGEVPAAEIRLHTASAKPLKSACLLPTVCRVLSRVHVLVFALRIKEYSASAPRSSVQGMRNAG